MATTTDFRHGVYTREIPTALLPARTVNSAVVFAVGTAPVHLLAEKGPVNEPRIYYSYSDFVQDMGWDEKNFSAYTLQELIYSHFALYRGAPVCVVNVFDPEVHASEIEDERIIFSQSILRKDLANLAHQGCRNLTLKSEEGEEYQEGSDYTFDGVSGLLYRKPDGQIPEGAAVLASYVYADVSKVTASDIIGGIELDGKATGLELIDEVFPRFRQVPSLVLAPHFCEDESVAVVMAAKADGINGLFKAICLIDLPTEGENAVTRYADLPAYKEKHNLTDGLMVLCWPKVKLGNNTYGLATHLAGLFADTDASHEGMPYASASNKVLNITSCGYLDKNKNWQEIWLDLPKANYLNGQGIYTVSNFDGGMKSWGGRMACYPSNTDPKDCQDAIRRFFNWYQAQFILTYFAKIDQPMNRRLIRTLMKSEQIKLDGWTSQEIILGGTISFVESENPLTDLIDGIMRFHIRVTPPPAAREIDGVFEFDSENLKVLFG